MAISTSPDFRPIVRAIEDNTRELKKLRQDISPKPKSKFSSEYENGQIVIHRAKYIDGYVFLAECSDKVLVDNEELTVSLNEKAINCPSCKL